MHAVFEFREKENSNPLLVRLIDLSLLDSSKEIANSTKIERKILKNGHLQIDLFFYDVKKKKIKISIQSWIKLIIEYFLGYLWPIEEQKTYGMNANS